MTKLRRSQRELLTKVERDGVGVRLQFRREGGQMVHVILGEGDTCQLIATLEALGFSAKHGSS